MAGLIFSCENENDENLELTILNESLNSVVLKNSNHNEFDLSEKAYKEISKNTIKFKIENKSDSTFILVFKNLQKNYFPDRFMSIGFENIIFKDQEDKPPKYSSATVNGKELFINFLDFQDSIQKQYYNNIGYNDKTDSWKRISSKVFKSIIVIHPKEVLYFETYTYLPYKWNNLMGDYGFVIFDKEKQYNAKLKFNFYTKNEVEQFLTDLQKKQINENDYHFFKGKLLSTNKIPIKFIN